MRYLRVSLLTACNLFCSYCRPKSSLQTTNPSYADITRLKSALRLLIDLGATKVRFTGGEPTLYWPLPDILAYVKAQHTGIHTAITTNGLLLATQAHRLAECGLDSVNVSLDTLNPTTYQALTGVDGLHRTLQGIEAAVAHVPSVKLNCVVMRRTNDKELLDLIMYADSRSVDIRFIELMPSRQLHATDVQFVGSSEIRRALPFPLEPMPHEPGKAARYYRSPALRIRIGFISPVSESFCDGCDRTRLASDGHLFRCLFSSESLDLFNLLAARPGSAPQEVLEYLSLAKPGIGAMGRTRQTDLPRFATMGG